MATGRIPINGTAAIQQTLIDAKGDLIAGTAADAVSRLAVGANDTVLTADSAQATGLKWATPASDFVLISANTFSAVSSVTLNNVFSATYNNYKLFITTTASPGNYIWARWRVSGSDASGSDYQHARLYTSDTTVGAQQGTSADKGQISDGGTAIAADITIYRPYLAVATLTTGYNLYNAPSTAINHGFYVTAHNVATSYTGMTFAPLTSTITGNYALYGMKV